MPHRDDVAPLRPRAVCFLGATHAALAAEALFGHWNVPTRGGCPSSRNSFASTPFAPSSSPSERALGYRHSPFAGASRHGRVIVGRDDEDGHGWGAVPDGLDDVPTAHLGIVSEADLTQGVKKLNALHVKVNRPSSRVVSLQARQGHGHGLA